MSFELGDKVVLIDNSFMSIRGNVIDISIGSIHDITGIVKNGRLIQIDQDTVKWRIERFKPYQPPPSGYNFFS